MLVIGAGVSGLTAPSACGGGFEVTVVADRFAPLVTSVVAGALWEWPPAVCGYHQDQVSLERSKVWAATSYEVFADLARDPATGVFLRPATFYLRVPIAEDRRQRAKMEELARTVRQFRHDPALIAENGVNPGLGLRDAYTHLAPMVDTDRYMRWLLDRAREAGCAIEQRRVVGSLRGQEEALAREYGAEAIVNCTGLGAGELAEDPMSPLRGALIRIKNDGRAMPRLTRAHCIAHDDEGAERGFLFIVPRGDDRAVLGGFAEPDEWDLDIGLHNYDPIRAIHRRCVEFLPALADAEIDADEPVRVGLRPFRRRNVRLEREPGSRIVHNYGHGGSGVTFSWGCALEIAAILAEGRTS